MDSKYAERSNSINKKLFQYDHNYHIKKKYLNHKKLFKDQQSLKELVLFASKVKKQTVQINLPNRSSNRSNVIIKEDIRHKIIEYKRIYKNRIESKSENNLYI